MTPMPPRRAWILSAVLSIALLGGAVAIATLLEPHTRDFDRFVDLAVWKIDFNERIDPEVLGYAVNVAASQGILGIVNLAGGHAGGGLERQVEAAARYPGRVLVFMEVDERGCCDAAWVDREVARAVSGRALGARGLHLPRPLVDPDGAPVPLDAEALDPLWQAVAGLQIPVSIDPGQRPGFPGTIARLAERQPALTIVALRMAGLAGKPADLSALLSRLPNLLVDTSGAIPDLGRDPEAARELLVAHAGRVLLGTDLGWLQGPRPELRALVIGQGTPLKTREPLQRFFDSTWRFLETRDPGIPGPVAGDKEVTGVGLPREALLPILRDNARLLLGFGDLEAR
jgi:predicted TIM-barrel fold metal-dependent hydrolase